MAIPTGIPQGTLNRLFTALNVLNNPGLNITAPYLGREMIRLAPEGNATARIPTATGIVTSPEPYQTITCTAHLIKTQPLAAAWQAVQFTNSLIGTFTVYPDVAPSEGGIIPYTINNGMFMNFRELSFNGENAEFVITLSGYLIINNFLWASAG